MDEEIKYAGGFKSLAVILAKAGVALNCLPSLKSDGNEFGFHSRYASANGDYYHLP